MNDAARTRLAVFGGAGRMGRALVREIARAEDLELAAAVVRDGSGAVGDDAGVVAGIGSLGVRCGTILTGAEVAVEFVGAAGFDEILGHCVLAGVPLVSGSTGLTVRQQADLDAAAERIPVLHAANMSLGVTVLVRLVAEAARALGEDADIEISELHHRGKRDAPSGTALMLAGRAAAARGQGRNVIRVDRHGDDAPRIPGEIGVTALRAGDVIGEHTVLFGLAGERLELTHRATDRRVFVHGALAAARYLVGREPGRYALADVLAA